jgi:hypothetical protein
MKSVTIKLDQAELTALSDSINLALSRQIFQERASVSQKRGDHSLAKQHRDSHRAAQSVRDKVRGASLKSFA